MRRGRGRGQNSASAIKAPAVAQLPWTQVDNHWSPVEPLPPEHLEKVHDKSMEIVENLGIKVLSQTARDYYRQAGADVDDSTEFVRMDRQLLLDLVAHAPDKFTLTPRNPDKALLVGGNRINFGMVSGTPNAHDAINGRRPGNLADYIKLIKLGQYFNIIHFFGNQTLSTNDLPANTRHLDTTLINLTLTDKVFMALSIGRGRVTDACNMVALARGISNEELAQSPTAITNINVNSPRVLDTEMSDAAITMAERGQGLTVTPFTLMGAMTPVTMAAACAQANAEALLTIALTQIVRPGAPVVYGNFTSNVDLRSGSPTFGTPENAKANLIGGQLARRYKLPHRTSACNASNCVDAQAVWETQMSLWGAVQTHGNMIYHSAGWLEGGLVASFEKFIIDVEMLQYQAELLKPVDVSDDEFGLDSMVEAGAGGHFFGTAHTMERYQTAFHQPFLSDWRTNENWVADGAKTATERATEIWQKCLDDYEEPVLEQDRREALEEYVAKRKEEIGDGEP
jgi:trimethylamine--corrinoid protein Co-methyltransferase